MTSEINPSNKSISGEAILRVGPVNPIVAQTLAEDYGAQVLPDDPVKRDNLLSERGHQIRIAVCSGRVGVGNELMKRLPNLEAIINFGVGYDASDIVQANERGIKVSNTPDVLTDCVADTALGLYINALRSLNAAEHFVRSGMWAKGNSFPLTTRASRKRVGILGLGRIGSAIARRLEAFDCEIHYHSRNRKPEVDYTYHGSASSLAEATEVLIVATAGGKQSAGLVDKEVLSNIGPNGYLINIARGSVVDETALVAALNEGQIAGAGLDVFVNEPNVSRQLLNARNVVLLPHLGSGTKETRAEMAALTLKNLRSYLNSGRLVTPIV